MQGCGPDFVLLVGSHGTKFARLHVAITQIGKCTSDSCVLIFIMWKDCTVKSRLWIKDVHLL